MKTYRIQHDWLFSDDELAYPRKEEDSPSGKFNFRKATPVRLSLLLSDEGARYFDYFCQIGCSILLLDDAEQSSNPVISSYKQLLVRALILRFGRKGVSCRVRQGF